MFQYDLSFTMLKYDLLQFSSHTHFQLQDHSHFLLNVVVNVKRLN